jgi:hypothetical protein
MTTNPLYNALSAIAYIAGIISMIFFAPVIFGEGQDSIFISMVMLALLVLSVCVMAYLFFYRPMIMILDGQREQGVKLFMHTVGLFAAGTVMLLLIAIVASR